MFSLRDFLKRSDEAVKISKQTGMPVHDVLSEMARKEEEEKKQQEQLDIMAMADRIGQLPPPTNF